MRQRGWWTLIALCSVAAAAAGCGRPAEAPDPAQFVGAWLLQVEGAQEMNPADLPRLEMSGDGKARRFFPPDPHPRQFTWYLRAGRLVFVPEARTGATNYDFRFEGPDRMVLFAEGHEEVYLRAGDG